MIIFKQMPICRRVFLTLMFSCKNYISVILILAGHCVCAQTQRVDSLKKNLGTAENTNQKLETLFALCHEASSLPPDTLYKYSLVAKAIADQKKDKLKIKMADYYCTVNLLAQGYADSSFKIADTQLKALHYNDAEQTLYADFSLLKAKALTKLNQNKEALKLLYILLADADKRDDTLTQVKTMNMLVYSYVTIGQDVEAHQWCLRALSLMPENKSLAYREACNRTLSNLGLTSLHIYETTEDKKYLDSAALYAEEAISMSTKNEFIEGMAYNYGTKGSVLGKRNQIKEGEACLLKSLALYKQINNSFYVINTMAVMGSFYATTNQPEKGIAICKEGIELSKIPAANMFLLGNLAFNYKLAGRYKEYGETMEQLSLERDSMYKSNSEKELSKFQTLYEVQKKENTIITQQYALTRKNYLIYGALALLAMTVVIAWVFFLNRRKNQQLKIQQMLMEQKKNTTQAVIQAEENERQRIAGDLHDSVAQKMVVAKLHMEALEEGLSSISVADKNIFNQIGSLIDESCTEVRNLSHTMMTHTVVESGLSKAIKRLIEKTAIKSLHINFHETGNLDIIPKNTQLIVYRVVQECIQNVIKHAGAETLDISMIAENDTLDIIVEDNGVGFDIAGIKDMEGSGMQHIAYRVNYLNGKLDISSQPGNGTVIAFYIPLLN